MWLKFRSTHFPLRRGETVVGRSPYCSVVVSNREVSRQHAVFTLVDDGLVIDDLDSANGTYVNGHRVTKRTKLFPGDQVRIGNEFLEVAGEPARSVALRHDTLRGQSIGADTGDSTQTQHHQVEIVEALVAGASEATSRKALAPAICQLVDAMLAEAGELSEDHGLRLAACVARVDAWFPDRSLAEWRRRARLVFAGRGIQLSEPPGARASAAPPC